MQKTGDEKAQTTHHIVYIDILRILSMLSVVFLHTAAGSLRGNLGSPLWHVANVMTTLMSSSVPIFFMISGAMLLSSEKTQSVEYTYKKRLPKAFIPFVVWSLVAIAYYGLMGFLSTGQINWMDAASKLKNIASQPTTVHLWFMYALIPLYMLSPLLKKLVDALSKGLMRYLLVLWLIFSSLAPTLSALLPKPFNAPFTFHSQFNLNFLTGYLGYFILGYVLFQNQKPLSKGLLTLTILIDTALISLGTWYMTLTTGQYSEVFKSYSKIFTLILSVALFLLVKELLRNRPLSRAASFWVNLLSSASFGIYLLHNLLVSFISRWFKLWPAQSILTLFVSAFLVFALSLVIIIILASIKPTCYLFTGQPFKSACQTMNIQAFVKRIQSRKTSLDKPDSPKA